tara:strand:- start:4751 stop:5887 length:1137 start_codon:yes stop_codon:yes gene_type:complete
MTRKFKWQINASAVGKLLGFFGKYAQNQAMAENWHMNLKRMPRFNAIPSFVPTEPILDEVIVQEIQKQPVYEKMVTAAVYQKIDQVEATMAIKKESVANNKRTVATVVELERTVKRARKYRSIVNFTKKSRGIDTCSQKGYFSVGGKIYYKKSRRTAILSSIEEAEKDGWIQLETVRKMEETIVIKKKEVRKTEQVVKHVERIITKKINTRRGIVMELTDLQKVQLLHPNVKAGNDSAKFLSVKREYNGVDSGQYNGFVIGKIDGYDTTTRIIYELKHRRAKLFNEIRRYEQVQCLLYLKMYSNYDKLTLVETFKEEQRYYDIQFKNDTLYWKKENETEFHEGLRWEVIATGLKSVVALFNRAEVDEQYRQTLVDNLF